MAQAWVWHLAGAHKCVLAARTKPARPLTTAWKRTKTTAPSDGSHCGAGSPFLRPGSVRGGGRGGAYWGGQAGRRGGEGPRSERKRESEALPARAANYNSHNAPRSRGWPQSSREEAAGGGACAPTNGSVGDG